MKKRKGVSSGSASKRPATVVNNITTNVKTMKNYFPPQPGPAPAPEAGPVVPPDLFPESEREVRMPHANPRYGTYRRIRSTCLGGLFGDCGHCTAKYLSIDKFAPDECLRNLRPRAAFLEKVEEYNEAYEARDLEAAREAREYLVEKRTQRCPPCRTTHTTLTGEKKACKEFWIATREARCLAQNGCRHQACVERGELAKYVLAGDHKDPEGLIDPANKKVERLGAYCWWSCNGGVAAMRAEVAKLQWPCTFCHQLEKTGSQANRNGDPALMPPGKWDGTEEEIAQYQTKHKATIKYPKQQHVDKEKLRRVCCLQCKRIVTKETVFAFHFDHRDELTKMMGGLAGKSGGVAGLVHNPVNAATLDKIEPILDAEMDKCDLLCANCHHRKTYGYPFRE